MIRTNKSNEEKLKELNVRLKEEHTEKSRWELMRRLQIYPIVS